MKTVAWVMAALLTGLVLGSWSMKADLRKARKEIVALKQELEKKGGRQTGLEGITSMLKLPAADRSRRPTERVAMASADSDATKPTPAAAFASGDSAYTNRLPHFRRRRADTNAVRERFQAAIDLWKVRADLARNSFVSNVTTSDNQTAQFEVTMAAMNLRLSNSILAWVEYVQEAQTVTPETSIKIMSDLSTTLVWAYNDLDRTMPEDWRDRAGPRFQVFDFINPQVAMPLVEVEEVFRQQDLPAAGNDAPAGASEAAFSVSLGTTTTNR
jgi:hypothetical protein